MVKGDRNSVWWKQIALHSPATRRALRGPLGWGAGGERDGESRKPGGTGCGSEAGRDTLGPAIGHLLPGLIPCDNLEHPAWGSQHPE